MQISKKLLVGFGVLALQCMTADAGLFVFAGRVAGLTIQASIQCSPLVPGSHPYIACVAAIDAYGMPICIAMMNPAIGP